VSPEDSGLGEQLLGWNRAFLRRISSPGARGSIYDGEEVSRARCYAGWWYSKVFAVGSVHPCCKAEFIVPGNIREKPFREIWNSFVQREFRRMRNTDYEGCMLPHGLNCAMVCDNFTTTVNRNLAWHREELEMDLAREIVGQLVRTGVKQITFSGGGAFFIWRAFRACGDGRLRRCVLHDKLELYPGG
jgi:hypothetical protein